MKSTAVVLTPIVINDFAERRPVKKMVAIDHAVLVKFSRFKRELVCSDYSTSLRCMVLPVPLVGVGKGLSKPFHAGCVRATSVVAMAAVRAASDTCRWSVGARLQPSV